jgi:hypothetical protein
MFDLISQCSGDPSLDKQFGSVINKGFSYILDKFYLVTFLPNLKLSIKALQISFLQCLAAVDNKSRLGSNVLSNFILSTK